MTNPHPSGRRAASGRGDMPLYHTAWHGTCPRCGRGRLFARELTVRERCESCGLPLGVHDSGDGPAFLLICVLGAVLVPALLGVAALFDPPLWLYAVLASLAILGGALALLRPAKALMVALQYRMRPQDYGEPEPGAGETTESPAGKGEPGRDGSGRDGSGRGSGPGVA